MLEAVFIVAAAATAIALVWFKPEATARWYKRIQQFRRIGYAIFIVLVAIVLIGSGNGLFVLWGFILLVLVALGLLVDGPLEDFVEDLR